MHINDFDMDRIENTKRRTLKPSSDANCRIGEDPVLMFCVFDYKYKMRDFKYLKSSP